MRMAEMIRETRSVCPVCMKNLPAKLLRDQDGVISLKKECPEHGIFTAPVWRGCLDFDRWAANSSPLKVGQGMSCPGQCGLCPEHESESCCVLLEVTKRCNLHCQFCFASGGEQETEPPLDTLKASIRDIVKKCGRPLLQLSGGEPTLRDDLPELVRYAREAGCSYVQVNTNGLRLAEDPRYAEALAEAGLDIVFLQFDGTDDRIYQTLRGHPLLEKKLRAIEVCGRLHMGVTLVPTVVPGINDQDLGALICLGQSLMPAVRGIHFQPVSYFGRYPGISGEDRRFTLDELLAAISRQTELPIESFRPSRCDHPLCGFHGAFVENSAGKLCPVSSGSQTMGRTSAGTNREYVARHWRCSASDAAPSALSEEMDFDTFLYLVRNKSLTLSAMAFQDAMNLNIERLHRCSLHVYSDGAVKPFCGAYLTPVTLTRS